MNDQQFYEFYNRFLQICIFCDVIVYEGNHWGVHVLVYIEVYVHEDCNKMSQMS